MLCGMTNSNASKERDERQGAMVRVFNRIQAMKDRLAGAGDLPVPGDELFLDPFSTGGTSSR